MQPRLNTHAWDVARAEVLREQSYLCPCGARADVVHHIVEIKDGGAAGDKANLQGPLHRVSLQQASQGSLTRCARRGTRSLK